MMWGKLMLFLDCVFICEMEPDGSPVYELDLISLRWLKGAFSGDG
jgi:hypothetical protein